MNYDPRYNGNIYGGSGNFTTVSILRMDTYGAATWIKLKNLGSNVFLINTFRDVTKKPNKDIPLDTVCGRHRFNQNRNEIGVVSVLTVRLQGNEFPLEHLMLSRARLEEAFQQCVQNGADIIVTPMFGAERDDMNPVESVAEVLISVIKEFAGRVKKVVIASSLEGRGDDFNKVAARILGVEQVFGFEQQSTSVDDVHNHYVLFKSYIHEIPLREQTNPVCPYGGACTQTHAQHFVDYVHPPLCPENDCGLLSDNYHKHLFWHPRECEYGRGCREIHNKYHSYFLSHNIKKAKLECKYGFKCTEILSKKHADEYAHPFLPVCPNILVCANNDPVHISTYAHLCKYGTKCPNESEEHLRKTIHLNVCKYNHCNDITDAHRDAFIHPGSPFPRIPCPRGFMCADETVDHRKEYSHYKTDGLACESKALNTYDPIDGIRHKDKPFYFVDFDGNVSGWEAKLDKYIAGAGGIDEDSPNFNAVRKWVSIQLPNHMCSGAVFLSMICTGTVSSLEHLRSMWEKPGVFIENAASLPHIAPLIAKIKTSRENLVKYLKKFIKKYKSELKDKHAAEIAAMNKDSTAHKALGNTPQFTSDDKKELIEVRSTIIQIDNESDLVEVENAYKDFVNHIYKLMTPSAGCQCKIDEAVRTNYTPFSIYGPHNHSYGGSEVVLVVSREVTFHPDFYICPTAASLYAGSASRSAIQKNQYVLDRTPWMGQNVPWAQHEKDYYGERFNPVAKRWTIAATKELIARAGVIFKKGIKDVTLDDVKKYWNGTNAHYVFEGHLPYSVPLSYVRHVIITQKAYNDVYASPFGKVAFDNWKAKHGDSFFSIVPGAVEVRKTSGTWLEENPPPAVDDPTGFCFTLDTKSYEMFVPIKLHEDRNNVYFSFMAKGGDFFFTLSTTPGHAVDGELRNTLTFYIDNDAMGLSVSLHPPSAQCKMVKTDKDACAARFNENCQHTPFIYYEVSLDYRKETVAVYHYGPSRSYNSNIFIAHLRVPGPRYTYISFSRINKKMYYELPVIWNLKQNDSPTPKETNALNHHKDNVITAIPTQNDVPIVSLPLCDKPFTCEIFTNGKHPEHSAHCNSFMHVCRKGETCPRLRSHFHCTTKLHMDKPHCPNPKCNLLQDPKHRMEYCHRGIWDYLIPCKDGNKCGKKGDQKHCLKYHHDTNYVYPDPKALRFITKK